MLKRDISVLALGTFSRTVRFLDKQNASDWPSFNAFAQAIETIPKYRTHLDGFPAGESPKRRKDMIEFWYANLPENVIKHIASSVPAPEPGVKVSDVEEIHGESGERNSVSKQKSGTPPKSNTVTLRNRITQAAENKAGNKSSRSKEEASKPGFQSSEVSDKSDHVDFNKGARVAAAKKEAIEEGKLVSALPFVDDGAPNGSSKRSKGKRSLIAKLGMERTSSKPKGQVKKSKKSKSPQKVSEKGPSLKLPSSEIEEIPEPPPDDDAMEDATIERSFAPSPNLWEPPRKETAILDALGAQEMENLTPMERKKMAKRAIDCQRQEADFQKREKELKQKEDEIKQKELALRAAQEAKEKKAAEQAAARKILALETQRTKQLAKQQAQLHQKAKQTVVAPMRKSTVNSPPSPSLTTKGRKEPQAPVREPILKSTDISEVLTTSKEEPKKEGQQPQVVEEPLEISGLNQDSLFYVFVEQQLKYNTALRKISSHRDKLEVIAQLWAHSQRSLVLNDEEETLDSTPAPTCQEQLPQELDGEPQEEEIDFIDEVGKTFATDSDFYTI